MKHLIKTGNTLHGVIGFRHEGNDQQYCEAGSVVQLEWQPEAGWGLKEAHYTDSSGNVVEIDIKTRVFEMPDSAIFIEGTFKRFVVEDWKNYNPGGGGTSDYNDLNNKPKINDVTLEGDMTSEQLGIIVTKRVVVDEEKLIGEWVEGGVTYDLYEKVVAFGKLPNNGQKQVEHGITNNVRFVDVKGFAYGNNNLSIPLANAQGTLFIYLGVGNTKITIDTNSDRSNLTGYVYLTFIRSKP